MTILSKLKLFLFTAALFPVIVTVSVYGNLGDRLFTQAAALGMGTAIAIGLLMPGVVQHWLFVRKIKKIRDFCMQVKQGNYDELLALPNEGTSRDDENELISLMRDMNWMARRIRLREDQLRETISKLDAAGAQLLSQKQALEEMNIRLTEMAMTDPLTGISNRRHFFDHVEQELHRNKGSISLLLIDIDYFKKINDEFGHQTGDEVLIQFANVISQSLRKTDMVARIGGEEFAILLPGTGKMTAAEIAAVVHQAIQNCRFSEKQDNYIQVTCSVGICSVQRPPFPKGELLYRFADTALYAAKAHGRNCLFSYNVNSQAVEQIVQIPDARTGDEKCYSYTREKLPVFL